MYFGPLSEDPTSSEFTKVITDEVSLEPTLDSIEPSQVQTQMQMQTLEDPNALLDCLRSDSGLEYYNDEDPDEERQVPILTEKEEEDSTLFDIISAFAPPPQSLHSVPSIMSRPPPSSFTSLASSVIFPQQKKTSEIKFRSGSFSLHEGLRSHRTPETPTLASLNSRNLPSPSIGTSKSSYFVPPSSFVSPGDLSGRRHKDAAAGSSFIPFIMGNSFLSSSSHLSHHGSPGSGIQVHATTVSSLSLYERFAEKDSEEKGKKRAFSPLQDPTGRKSSAAEVADLLQTLDIKDKEKEKDRFLPSKSSTPSHLQAKKGPDGLLPSPPVQPTMRFSKQDVLGMIEKLLKRPV